MKLKAILTAIVTSVVAATATHAETLALAEQPMNIRATPLLDLFQRAPDAKVTVYLEQRMSKYRPNDCYSGWAEVKNADVPERISFYVCDGHRRHEDLKTEAVWRAFFLQPSRLPEFPDEWTPDLPPVVHSLADVMHWTPSFDWQNQRVKVNFTLASAEAR